MTPKEAHELFLKYGSIRKSAKVAGKPRTSFRRLLKRFTEGKAPEKEIEGCNEKLEQKWHPDGSVSVVVQGQSIKTKEDALAYAGLDSDEWEVKECQVTSWPTPMKIKQTKTVDSKEVSYDQPMKVYNFRVYVKVIPKATPAVQVALENLIEEINSEKFSNITPNLMPPEGEHSYVLSLYDHHFGMLAWGKEVGADYDLKIQEKYFVKATEILLSKGMGMACDEIVIPIGNDFFHINDPSNATPKNKNRLDVDGRMAKIFQTGFNSIIQTVSACVQVAPVKLLWVPGNHDPETSWFLTFALKQAFKNNQYVTVDCSPKPRKVYRYGVTVIMFTHGQDEKETDLPMLLVDECGPEMLEGTYEREIHTGHLHQRKERESKRTYNHQGTTVRKIGSLCPRDFYGYSKGYLAPRAAEMFIYNRETGLAGEVIVSEREIGL